MNKKNTENCSIAKDLTERISDNINLIRRRNFIKSVGLLGSSSLLLGQFAWATGKQIPSDSSLELSSVTGVDLENYDYLTKAFGKMNGYKKVLDLKPEFNPESTVKLAINMPEELKRAWELAIFETESNFTDSPYGGRYFSAGGRGGWYNMVFGQDTFGSGLLALNKMYPELMRSHLRTYCLARVNIGFQGPRNWFIEGLEKSVPLDMDVWVPDSMEFVKRYFISPALNRTGMDVGWMWVAADLFELHGDLMDWAWLYSMGDLFFDYFYKPFYDEKDGLFWGQASFIDVGGNGYPPEFGRLNQEARNKCLWIKATSTNCEYVKDMDAMSYAAEILGMPEKANYWKERASKLRKDIRDNLRFENGAFTYFKYPDGHLENRQEALGAAFSILADVVKGDEAIAAIKDFPITEIGVPIIFPFYENNQSYHNNTSWPFVNAFFMLACEKATGRKYIKEHALMAASSITDGDRINIYNKQGQILDISTGTFWEVIDWKSKEASGVAAQMWTICGFMNLCMRAGWTVPDLTKESRFFNTNT